MNKKKYMRMNNHKSPKILKIMMQKTKIMNLMNRFKLIKNLSIKKKLILNGSTIPQKISKNSIKN